VKLEEVTQEVGVSALLILPANVSNTTLSAGWVADPSCQAPSRDREGAGREEKGHRLLTRAARYSRPLPYEENDSMIQWLNDSCF